MTGSEQLTQSMWHGGIYMHIYTFSVKYVQVTPRLYPSIPEAFIL